MTGRRARRTATWIRYGVRLAIAGALVAAAFRLVVSQEQQGLAESLRAAWTTSVPEALFWMTLAWALLGVALVVGTFRFRMLLLGAGFEIEWRTLLGANLVATFLNTLLPGAVLGDVYRVWDTRRDAGSGAGPAGVVILERLLGLAALGSIALLALPAVPLAAQDVRLAWLLAGLSSVFCLLPALVLHPGANARLRALLRRFGRPWPFAATAAERAVAAVAAVSERPAVILRAFALSLAVQALPVVAVMLLAVPLDASVAWYWFPIVIPFVALVSMLPVSVGGTGVREYFYVTLFGAVGMSSAAALVLSLTNLAISIVWALIGVAALVLRRRGAPRASHGRESSAA